MYFLLSRVYLAKASDRDPKPKASMTSAVVSIIFASPQVFFRAVFSQPLNIFPIFNVFSLIFFHLFGYYCSMFNKI